MAKHLDQSTAPLDEKLRRFLLALAKPDEVHFYGDGFPRPTIASEAYAFLADMAAGRLVVTPGEPAAPAANTPTQAVQDLLAEREKQRGIWGAAHDDEHNDGSMARAAATYCLCAEGPPPPGTPSELHSSRRWDFNILRAIWPSQWVFRPKDRRSNLIRAAALLLAEIERMDRAERVLVQWGSAIGKTENLPTAGVEAVDGSEPE